MTIHKQEVLGEHEIYLKQGGSFRRPRGVLKVKGPDSADFLHRMTTQDIKGLTPGVGAPAALLQANGMLTSMMELYHCGQFFLLVTDQNQLQVTFDHLEKFHFAENLEITDVSDEFSFVSVQGLKQTDGLFKTLGRLPKINYEIIGTEECLIINAPDFTNTQGFHLLVKEDRTEDVLSRLGQVNIKPLSDELWRLLRFEDGFFTYGVDISEKNLILESSLAEYVSRNKGCYPGQEVVERVFTYGNVAKKLVGLEFSDVKNLPEPQSRLVVGAEPAGTLTSVFEIPWSGKVLGFGILRKPYYADGTQVSVTDSGVTAKIKSLPHSFDIHREVAQLSAL